MAQQRLPGILAWHPVLRRLRSASANRRDWRRLCYLGSKIKSTQHSSGNDNELKPSADQLKCNLADAAERDLGAGRAQVSQNRVLGMDAEQALPSHGRDVSAYR